MDYRHLALAVIVILALIFIKKVWKLALLLALGAAVYWYFFIQ